MIMEKINKFVLIKYKKQIQELFKLGKQYDKETDPEKKEQLKAEVIKRCNELKPKLKSAGCSDEEAQDFLGVPDDASLNEDAAKEHLISKDDKTQSS